MNTLQPLVNGKALIYTEAADDQYVFSGHPTSFTGSGTTLSIPLGLITKQIAIIVFGKIFREGADSANSIDKATNYTVVVTPKVTHFEYAYNQLKNLGFAITPETRLTLNVKLFDKNNKLIFEKSYDSSLASGETYVISGEPDEKVNQIVHKTLFDLMRQAAMDAAQVIADKKLVFRDRLDKYIHGYRT